MLREGKDSCRYKDYCQAGKKSREEEPYHVIATPSLPVEILNVRHRLHNRDESG